MLGNWRLTKEGPGSFSTYFGSNIAKFNGVRPWASSEFTLHFACARSFSTALQSCFPLIFNSASTTVSYYKYLQASVFIVAHESGQVQRRSAVAISDLGGPKCGEQPIGKYACSDQKICRVFS